MSAERVAGEVEQPFLTARWHDLVMITWAVNPALLRSLLPAGTELDLWQGDALLSLVAFDFADTRVRGFRIPFHARFPEVNLRFYVRRKMRDGTWRRGVVFVQEMVPRAAIAFVARRVYGEPYVVRPMRHVAVPERAADVPPLEYRRSLVYEWHREGEWERVVALLTAAPRPMRSGSIEAFVVNQAWGYTPRTGRSTMEYRVEHPPWLVTRDAECVLEADFETLFGRRFAAALETEPVSTLVAEGSAVAVYPGRPIS